MSATGGKPPGLSPSERADQLLAYFEQLQIEFEMNRSRYLQARADHLSRIRVHGKEPKGNGAPGQ